ncbi:4Fe-4S dicluster domain-containing protein [Arsenicicoccus piscis]|uniref:Fe-S oxidoreductase n=1 Tax=Arsenicicoccus piscis TaxID=673954 RepID=A0ABQ6HTW8_9MICO|nr:(Fe-S)-binding protein [Arsenicicoccus piscis]MCH8626511.1 4Fe-4S dicluster domain-containing protein [Arsenicicoccus piscis]GMA21149.1 Fe-S oxidoreductase [Arsenicicoccus piscis]
MSALQITAIALCFTIPLLGWVLLFRQAFRFYRLFTSGSADPTRTDQPATRTVTLLREFLGHTRMSRLPIVSIAHWFTALSFLILFATLVNAFFQLIWADFRLPIIGHFPPFEWLIETFAWGGFIGIIVLIVIRQRAHPRSADGDHGRRSRFYGSTWWQAYYVEFTILAVTICILLLRTLEAALLSHTAPGENLALHFPLTLWLSGIWSGLSVAWIEQAIYLVAMIKILVSFAWMITISLQPTMGVAWHRFLAFFNIWFKRNADGRPALGAVPPMRAEDGSVLTTEALEEMEELPRLGVGSSEDFTWKQLLDFTTCTECGRCQSQCPAWNTDKPLSPKMLVMTLRDHAHAKAPWALASEEVRAGLPEHTRALAEVPLVGATGYDPSAPLSAYDALGPSAVVDADVLWSCTTCGACVEQCPVDIEHVDAIVDLRRHQTLIESAFPSELGGLFKNMESKGNPWGMSPKARLDWAKDLPFPVRQLGQEVESLDQVDYLFWVGCAGAYEDRAKKTSRAVAELLDTAGVTFAVLGNGESCTGDSARRAGNELLFQALAQQNVETLNEAGATRIIVTCAHCFNTLKNEYPQLGGDYEVLHHTQVLNQLVRDKRLVPVARPDESVGMSTAKNPASTAPAVTYHDPCYLGRHNQVYAPPRELIGSLPGVELREMPRHGEKSFCCGAGGARMWMEEKLGTRINVNRTEEALATGAERIAVGCPFCRVMLSDGVTAAQQEGRAEEVEVVDVAQMLLAAVNRGRAVEEVVVEEAVVDETVVENAGVDEAEVDEPVAPVAAPAAERAPAVAAPATPAAQQPDAADEVADPWDDEPDAAPAPAAQAKAEPAAAAPAPTDVADPWDDDEPAATPASAAKTEPAAAPAHTEVADPWDDDESSATPTPAAKAEPAPTAPATAEVADPWDD